MGKQHDWYRTPGVSDEVGRKAIKRAHYKLALKSRSDRNKEPGTADRLKEIAEAHSVLHGLRKHAEYDGLGLAGIAGFLLEGLLATPIWRICSTGWASTAAECLAAKW